MEKKTLYIHKFSVGQCYGGPEEGGWWYDAGSPTDPERPVFSLDVSDEHEEELVYAVCRAFNQFERDRAEREEDYGYTSVLSHRSNHFTYDIGENRQAVSFPQHRPHYE